MDDWQTETSGPSEGAASASAGGDGDNREEMTGSSASGASTSWQGSSGSASDTQPSTSTTSPPSGRSVDKENLFECNICLDSPTDPVVSLCGHLFCWACLHGWLEMRPPGQQSCPVCKAGVTREKVVPLYGRNSTQQDPRKKPVPPRPRAQRTEAPNPGLGGEFFHFPGFGGGGNGGGNGGGFHVSVGLGMFPFTFFSAAFNGPNGNAPAQNGLVSQVFLWLAVMLIIWIIFY